MLKKLHSTSGVSYLFKRYVFYLFMYNANLLSLLLTLVQEAYWTLETKNLAGL